MPIVANQAQSPATIHTDLGAIFVSLELSRSTWLITSLSPGGGEKMSKHSVCGGDISGLLERFRNLREKALSGTAQQFPIIVIQEAGLDGFWIHRVLIAEGIESHVVDPASIATSRRRRRAKTDKIDGEALVRALLAYKRCEPRVCAMVRVPTPEEEDRRRLSRERKALTNERVRHVNRIKGMLFGQGVSGYAPPRRNRRRQLEELRSGDGRVLPHHLKAQISRELDRLELLLEQIKAVEGERDELLASAQIATPAPAMLLGLKGKSHCRPGAPARRDHAPHLVRWNGVSLDKRERAGAPLINCFAGTPRVRTLNARTGEYPSFASRRIDVPRGTRDEVSSRRALVPVAARDQNAHQTGPPHLPDPIMGEPKSRFRREERIRE